MDKEPSQELLNEYVQKYKNEIVPFIKDLNNEKKIMWQKISAIILKLIVTLAIFILFGIIYINLPYNELLSTVYLIVFAAFFISLLLFLYSKFYYTYISKTDEKNLKYGQKKKIMPIICKCYPDLKWFPSDMWNESHFLISEKNYKNASVIPHFDYMIFDDSFIGSYKKINYTIEELKAFDTSVTNEKAESICIFHGVIITFDMNKNFKGHTIIRQDSEKHNLCPEHLHYTELEDVDFEKKFDVYTNDDVEARYLITPSFMEKINNIKVRFSSDKIMVSFYKNKLYVAISTNEDLFEIVQLVENVEDEKYMYKIFYEISSILKLIDYFKLDQKIGM